MYPWFPMSGIRAQFYKTGSEFPEPFINTTYFSDEGDQGL